MIPFPKAPRSQEYIRKEGKKKEEKRKSNVERGKEVEGLTRFVIHHLSHSKWEGHV